jgi:hypothetical protein
MQGIEPTIDGLCTLPIPASAASHMSCIIRGARFAVTEITPSPPSSMNSHPVASSPL